MSGDEAEHAATGSLFVAAAEILAMGPKILRRPAYKVSLQSSAARLEGSTIAIERMRPEPA